MGETQIKYHYSLRVRLASEAINHVLDVHFAGDKLRLGLTSSATFVPRSCDGDWIQMSYVARHLSIEVSKVSTLSQGIARIPEPNVSVFNQLPQSAIERVFGRRSAPFSGVEGGRCLKSPGKMTQLVIRGRGTSASTPPWSEQQRCRDFEDGN
jgi:hypothetical protein